MRWSLGLVVRRVVAPIGLVAVALVVAGAAGASGAHFAGSGTRSRNVGPGDNYFARRCRNLLLQRLGRGEYANSDDSLLRTLVEH
jgi:hypothetical protein